MKTFVVFLSHKNLLQFSEGLLMAHIDYLKHLHDQGNLIVCGPMENKNNAILVIRARDKEAAIAWVRSDPFVKEKYYQQYFLQEFTAANPENNWLQ